jgi:hypothetical protein
MMLLPSRLQPPLSLTLPRPLPTMQMTPCSMRQ